MRVILNSDVLYTGRLVRSLPRSWEKFARDCASVGAVITLPRTAHLEVERRQAELREADISELNRSRAVLVSYDVQIPEIQAADLVRTPDVAALFKATGATFEIVDPTLDDYRGAERRAALHLAPLRPQSESDEMRDLVIWELSCRLARSGNGAVLVSRDHVHGGREGDEEAASAGLQRVSGFDAALDILGVESPRAKLVREILSRIWQDLRRSLPLPEEVSVRRLTNVTFVQGEQSIGRARFTLRAGAKSGGILSGDAEIEAFGEEQIHARVTNIAIDGKSFDPATVDFILAGTLPTIANDLPERIADLKALLES